MIKFIVNEQPSEKGIHHIHNASLGCADLPVTPPFLIELMGRKSKALLLFKNRWTTIY